MISNVIKNALQPNRFNPLRGCGFALLAALFLTGLAACDSTPPAPPAPPPAEVTVAHPLRKEVIEWDTYTGYLQAKDDSSVVPRVSGLIMSMPFVEGSIVKQGDVLAVIDDRPYKADLDSKVADEKKAQAALEIADLTLKRLLALRKSEAVSQQDIDNANATLAQAQATLLGAQAAVTTSTLNLQWCKVISPIDGRVGYKLVTVGNLVNNAISTTVITTVESIDPIYCYVNVDEHSVLKYQKLAQERKLTSARDGKIPCYIQLANENDSPHEGYIDFVDNHVDTATGTQIIRGLLKNPTGQFTPGLFARLSVPGSGRYKALLVPDTAIGNDQSEHNVLVVDKDNKVSARPVVLGALFGKLRSIVSGLKDDDRVIINGQMHARPGATVNPKETTVAMDALAFPDPGPAVAEEIPATQPGSNNASLSVSTAQVPTTQSSIGNPQ